MKKLFLDDERHPPDESWTVARSYDEAVKLVEKHGVPSVISLDHDLGGEKTGYDFAKYLIQKDHETGFSFLPREMTVYLHTANPVGMMDMAKLFNRHAQITGKKIVVKSKPVTLRRS